MSKMANAEKQKRRNRQRNANQNAKNVWKNAKAIAIRSIKRKARK